VTALTQALGQQAEAATHLQAAHTLFMELRVPWYVERTAQLARELKIPINSLDPYL
jgi:hypothetical protein